MSDVTIEKSGRIAIVRFDRGSRANPLSLQVMRDLTDAARSFETDVETSAIVLAGGENFSMGFDLRDEEAIAKRAAPLAEKRFSVATGRRMCQAWADLQPLTISAINGWCVGGGAALAVATDLRVMANGAHFYVPEIERGMNMSWGSVPRITNLVGPAKAKRIVVLAEKLDALRALDWGIADEVVADPMAKAMEMAERAASMPPVALRMCKQQVDAYANALAHTASHMDFDQFALSQTGGDFEEAVSAFFEKRDPKFTGA